MLGFSVVRSWGSGSESFVDVVCITPESEEATGMVRLYACDSESIVDTELYSQDELGIGEITGVDSPSGAAWNFRSLRVIGSGQLPKPGELLTSRFTQPSHQIRCEVKLLLEDANDSPVSTLEKIRLDRINSLFGDISSETHCSPNRFRAGSILIFNRTSIHPDAYGIVELCSDLGKSRFSALIKTVLSGDLSENEVLSMSWLAKLALLPTIELEEALEGFETLERTVPIVEIQNLANAKA